MTPIETLVWLAPWYALFTLLLVISLRIVYLKQIKPFSHHSYRFSETFESSIWKGRK